MSNIYLFLNFLWIILTIYAAGVISTKFQDYVNKPVIEILLTIFYLTLLASTAFPIYNCYLIFQGKL
jgi:hypothetical protein